MSQCFSGEVGERLDSCMWDYSSGTCVKSNNISNEDEIGVNIIINISIIIGIILLIMILIPIIVINLRRKWKERRKANIIRIESDNKKNNKDE
jgi:hypothetical protein